MDVRAAEGPAWLVPGSAILTLGGLVANQEAGIVPGNAEDGAGAIDAVLHGIKAWAEPRCGARHGRGLGRVRRPESHAAGRARTEGDLYRPLRAVSPGSYHSRSDQPSGSSKNSWGVISGVSYWICPRVGSSRACRSRGLISWTGRAASG